MYCVVCKCGLITLFSVQISCHLLTRCIISPTGHKNISLLDKFHAGYIGCIVTCHVKCRLIACCILSGLDAHCVLLHRAASAQMTKYSPLVDIRIYRCFNIEWAWSNIFEFSKFADGILEQVCTVCGPLPIVEIRHMTSSSVI